MSDDDAAPVVPGVTPKATEGLSRTTTPEMEDSMTTTVLVTGATGFVGSHVLGALASRADVRGIASARDAGRLETHWAGQMRVGDFRDPEYTRKAVDGVDVVCLCHAWSSLFGNADNSRRLYLEPALAVIEAAREAGVKRVVFASTTSAAAPERSAYPDSRGIARAFWPHLVNVVRIEDKLRELARPEFQVINLRLGLFAGRRYGLGLLPILLPRLKTHLVPWVAGGRTAMPIVDGEDIGEAFALAATVQGLAPYEGFNIVGPEVPTARQVIQYLRDEFGYPTPHFSVPFALAYPFAWTMEAIDPLVPWQPLVTRSIIHLLEDVSADNAKAERLLGYRPRHHWKEAIAKQVAEMYVRQKKPMAMAQPVA